MFVNRRGRKLIADARSVHDSHLLIALVMEDQGIAPRAVNRLGWSKECVVAAAEHQIGSGSAQIG